MEYLSTPTRVTFPGATGGVRLVSAGYSTTCAVTGPMELWCWGENTGGQAGTSFMTIDLFEPRRIDVQPTDAPLAISVGYNAACRLGSTAELECWGHNDSGELGDGGAGPSTHVPQALTGLWGI